MQFADVVIVVVFVAVSSMSFADFIFLFFAKWQLTTSVCLFRSCLAPFNASLAAATTNTRSRRRSSTMCVLFFFRLSFLLFGRHCRLLLLLLDDS